MRADGSCDRTRGAAGRAEIVVLDSMPSHSVVWNNAPRKKIKFTGVLWYHEYQINLSGSNLRLESSSMVAVIFFHNKNCFRFDYLKKTFQLEVNNENSMEVGGH